MSKQIVSFKNVESKNIKAVGYNPALKQLHIKFNYTGNKVYVYEGVPKGTYEKLISAESIGSYFHTNVRYKYSEGKGYYG